MARPPRKIQPKETTDTDWRIPTPSGKYTDSLGLVPKNGAWYIMAEALGLSTAEQAARGLNHDGSPWTWGYHVRVEGTDLVSDLAVRWVGSSTTTTGATS